MFVGSVDGAVVVVDGVKVVGVVELVGGVEVVHHMLYPHIVMNR